MHTLATLAISRHVHGMAVPPAIPGHARSGGRGTHVVTAFQCNEPGRSFARHWQRGAGELGGEIVYAILTDKQSVLATSQHDSR